MKWDRLEIMVTTNSSNEEGERKIAAASTANVAPATTYRKPNSSQINSRLTLKMRIKKMGPFHPK